MERTVVLGAARTPFGKFGGALSPLSAPELGGATIRNAIDRSGIEDGELEHSVFGIFVQAGVGQIPSRQANFHAGLPFSLTTETLNQVCASGLRSVTPRHGHTSRPGYALIYGSESREPNTCQSSLPCGEITVRLKKCHATLPKLRCS